MTFRTLAAIAFIVAVCVAVIAYDADPLSSDEHPDCIGNPDCGVGGVHPE